MMHVSRLEAICYFLRIWKFAENILSLDLEQDKIIYEDFDNEVCVTALTELLEEMKKNDVSLNA